MKRWLLAVVLLGGATATVVPWVRHDGVRSVRLLLEPPGPVSTQLEARQSAALFVGVRDFAAVAQVPFAVDDAVDLAYAFAIERRISLVPPGRVVLVLSSPYPVKPQSRDHLRVLREAGSDIRYHADAADIAAALREQSALAGRDGMLIVSIAAHGLLREGNGYVLGRSSLVRDSGTMLATNDIFETIATSRAQRSLVFLDACRERMTTGTRSVLASAMSAAPLLERRGRRARGQAVFYAAAAGGWAYDDPVAQNGVFTEAVIDGMLNCSAGRARDVITADTLSRYVAHYVKEWIQKNRDPNVVAATQASIDGDARDMPLARCGGSIIGGPERATAAGSAVCAFSKDQKLLWQYDAGSAVTGTTVIDLDADGWGEVVFGTRDAIAALDDQGKLLWTAHEPMALAAFVTGPLSRKPMKNVVALWSGKHTSRLAVYAPDGKRGPTFDSARFDRIAIARATNRHTPRLAVTSGNTLMAFDAKSLAAGKSLWSGRITPRRDHIASLDVVDGNGDGKCDIAVTTASGAKVFVDVYGHAVRTTSGAGFVRITRGARSRR